MLLVAIILAIRRGMESSLQQYRLSASFQSYLKIVACRDILFIELFLTCGRRPVSRSLN